ncbi:MAG: TonB-dependent receptor, partial [Verrucomicrobiae bacterium]|nr:TonB-dependent receptor [Verrucomicrobiae bacterium]
WLLISHGFLLAQDETVELEPMEIIGERSFEHNLGISTERLMGETDTSLSIDQALRRLTSVDTFRSLDSFTAHPTTQGVRFRHAATNGTSRALVLVDGVPQNDPFGGWIYWNKLPTESIRTLEIFPIGSVPAWGNYSSGGAIHLTTLSPFADQSHFSVLGGSFNTFKAALQHTAPVSDNLGIAFEGRWFTTDGYSVVRPDQEGPVDEASNSDYDYLRLQLAGRMNEEWEWRLTGQHFTEERINGTPLSPNSTEATDLSWTLSRQGNSGPDFNFVSYYQNRDFQNIFTSVEDDRASEQPVLDQYAVPAEAFGALATLYWEGGGHWNVLAGADFQEAEGSANELTRNLGQGFTRERREGGKQSFAGAFVTLQTFTDEDSNLEGTLRLDHWKQTDGYRDEYNLENDTQTGETDYPFRSGDVVSFNTRYTRRLDPNWSFEALVFHGFRAPTLNELYRPFRVRNDITESNSDLSNESSRGGELSLFYQDEANTFELTGFYYDMDDMVTNVFLHDNPGFDSLCGFVPAGGSCHQRLNVENSRVQGFEVAWMWVPGTDFEFLLNYTFSDTEFRKSSELPALEGDAFPLAPKNQLSTQLVWHGSEELDVIAQLQYRDSHFDNAPNTRKIDDSVVVNLGAHYALQDSPWSFRLQLDNLLDEEIITAISSNGIYTRAAPFSAWASVSYQR